MMVSGGGRFKSNGQSSVGWLVGSLVGCRSESATHLLSPKRRAFMNGFNCCCYY